MTDDFDEDGPMAEGEHRLAGELGQIGHHQWVTVQWPGEPKTMAMMWVPPVGFWDAARMRQRERRQREGK